MSKKRVVLTERVLFLKWFQMSKTRSLDPLDRSLIRSNPGESPMELRSETYFNSFWHRSPNPKKNIYV